MVNQNVVVADPPGPAVGAGRGRCSLNPNSLLFVLLYNFFFHMRQVKEQGNNMPMGKWQVMRLGGAECRNGDKEWSILFSKFKRDMVEHLLCKQEVLSSNPSIIKKKKIKLKREKMDIASWSSDLWAV
jgi:hypothetical protein